MCTVTEVIGLENDEMGRFVKSYPYIGIINGTESVESARGTIGLFLSYNKAILFRYGIAGLHRESLGKANTQVTEAYFTPLKSIKLTNLEGSSDYPRLVASKKGKILIITSPIGALNRLTGSTIQPSFSHVADAVDNNIGYYSTGWLAKFFKPVNYSLKIENE
jgi:hypothetical protein